MRQYFSFASSNNFFVPKIITDSHKISRFSLSNLTKLRQYVYRAYFCCLKLIKACKVFCTIGNKGYHFKYPNKVIILAELTMLSVSCLRDKRQGRWTRFSQVIYFTYSYVIPSSLVLLCQYMINSTKTYTSSTKEKQYILSVFDNL